MKLVSTFVRPELVGSVVDMLRTLGYTHLGVGHRDPVPDADDAQASTDDVRVEVVVKEVDAPGAAVALTRATFRDPRPVLVTEAPAAALPVGGHRG